MTSQSSSPHKKGFVSASQYQLYLDNQENNRDPIITQPSSQFYLPNKENDCSTFTKPSSTKDEFTLPVRKTLYGTTISESEYRQALEEKERNHVPSEEWKEIERRNELICQQPIIKYKSIKRRKKPPVNEHGFPIKHCYYEWKLQKHIYRPPRYGEDSGLVGASIDPQFCMCCHLKPCFTQVMFDEMSVEFFKLVVREELPYEKVRVKMQAYSKKLLIQIYNRKYYKFRWATTHPECSSKAIEEFIESDVLRNKEFESDSEDESEDGGVTDSDSDFDKMAAEIAANQNHDELKKAASISKSVEKDDGDSDSENEFDMDCDNHIKTPPKKKPCVDLTISSAESLDERGRKPRFYVFSVADRGKGTPKPIYKLYDSPESEEESMSPDEFLRRVTRG